MSVEEVRDFNFVFDYLVNETDMTKFQRWLRAEYRGITQGAFGPSCLSGLKVTQSSGLQMSVSIGIAVNEDGRMLYLDTATADTPFASPVANPARSLIVLRPINEPTAPTPEPLDPGTDFYLNDILFAEVIIIDGTPAATPVYPSIEPGDVILAGFLIPAGAVGVTIANEELYKRDVPTQLEQRIRAVLSTDSTYTVTAADQILEIANAQVNLPADPKTVIRKLFKLVNKRTVGNAVLVSGNGNNISGQASLSMDDRWSTLEIYSNGVEYVVI